MFNRFDAVHYGKRVTFPRKGRRNDGVNEWLGFLSGIPLCGQGKGDLIGTSLW